MNCETINELSKRYTTAIQGIALLLMLLLHLFCRKENLPYNVNLYINDIPVLYYFGLWGDQCVALFCFCAGYASYLQQEKFKTTVYIEYSAKRVLKLLINFWIIIALFSIIGLFTGNSDIMPGSIGELLGNLFLFKLSYNGAWWFMLTYVFLMLLSPLLYRIIKKIYGMVVFLGTGGIYFLAYLIRFQILFIPDLGSAGNWCVTQGALLGTSLLPYIWGMLFYKYKIISILRHKGENLPKITIFIISIVAFGLCINVIKLGRACQRIPCIK